MIRTKPFSRASNYAVGDSTAGFISSVVEVSALMPRVGNADSDFNVIGVLSS